MRCLAWVVTVLSLAVFGLCGPSLAQQWQEYRSGDGSYRVEFPAEPRIVTRTVRGALGAIDVTAVVAVHGTGAYIVNQTELPRESLSADPQTLLDSARDGGVRNANGRLREEHRLSVDGAPARRFVIDIAEDKVGVTLAVVSGHVLLTAIYVGRPGSEDTADVQRFIGSFRLVRN